MLPLIVVRVIEEVRKVEGSVLEEGGVCVTVLFALDVNVSVFP